MSQGVTESTPLREWMLEKFPNTPDTFSTSLARKVLNELSLFFLFPPIPMFEATSMHSRYQAVQATPRVLETLKSMAFVDGDDHSFVQDAGSVKVKPKSQKKVRQAKQAARTPSVDPEPFNSLGVPVPSCRDDAKEVALTILASQKSILDVRHHLSRYLALRDTYHISIRIISDASVHQKWRWPLRKRIFSKSAQSLLQRIQTLKPHSCNRRQP